MLSGTRSPGYIQTCFGFELGCEWIDCRKSRSPGPVVDAASLVSLKPDENSICRRFRNCSTGCRNRFTCSNRVPYVRMVS